MADSRYLLRFDDICPTLNWAVWEAIEPQLERHGLRPIMAVIPDNRDCRLMVDSPAPDFWDRVRRWQAMGYAIALHGHQHVYVNEDKGLIGLTPNSEFAGLPYAEQRAKLTRALSRFAEEGVRADAWVAPSHSFDRTTLKVLVELGLTVISDGLWRWPHAEGGSLFWVPQQLWEFEPKPSGVWTVCNHLNAWDERKLAAFGQQLARYAGQITDLATVTRAYAGRTLTVSDRVGAFFSLRWEHRLRRRLSALRRRLFMTPRRV